MKTKSTTTRPKLKTDFIVALKGFGLMAEQYVEAMSSSTASMKRVLKTERQFDKFENVMLHYLDTDPMAHGHCGKLVKRFVKEIATSGVFKYDHTIPVHRAVVWSRVADATILI